METDPNPNILTKNFNDENDMVSVENPPRRIPLFLASLWSLYERHYPPGFPRKVVAEIISTFLLVFVTCGSAALSAASDQHKVSQLGASVAGGLVVTVMIYSVGHISGAHMNPAVTVAFAAIRQLPWNQVPLYATAQITGSIAASFTLRVILHPIQRIGTTSPSGTNVQALVMEIVVTFSMMFLTTAVATDTKARGELGGIAVGSAVCITSILAGPISGGSMNPARSIGPAIASNYYKGIWVYVVGPLMGTLLGALSYNFVRDSDNNLNDISSPEPSPNKVHRLQINDHPGKLLHNNYGLP